MKKPNVVTVHVVDFRRLCWSQGRLKITIKFTLLNKHIKSSEQTMPLQSPRYVTVAPQFAPFEQKKEIKKQQYVESKM